MRQRYFFLYIFFCFSHITHGMARSGGVEAGKRTSKDLQQEWEGQTGAGIRRVRSVEKLRGHGKDWFKLVETEPGQILAVKSVLEKKRKGNCRE